MNPIRIKLPKPRVDRGTFAELAAEILHPAAEPEVPEPLEIRDSALSPEEMPETFTVKCPNCGEYHESLNNYDFPCDNCWIVDRNIRRWIAFPLAQQTVLKLLRERGIVE